VNRNRITGESGDPARRRKGRRRHGRFSPWLLITLSAVLVGSGASAATATASSASSDVGIASLEVQSLDGSRNNQAHPDWGKLGLPYLRVAPANYRDGTSTRQGGPNTRFVSNRIFNDVGQNVFSERSVTQWGWTWGQFLDHTFGLAQGGGETANTPFNSHDPMESFRDDLGVIPFTRDLAAPGTGTSTSVSKSIACARCCSTSRSANCSASGQRPEYFA